jgi:hypothetical protein
VGGGLFSPENLDETVAILAGAQDELGDIERMLALAEREELPELYTTLRLTVSYDHRSRVADVSISPEPRVVKYRVRGGTRTLTTRIQLNV